MAAGVEMHLLGRAEYRSQRDSSKCSLGESEPYSSLYLYWHVSYPSLGELKSSGPFRTQCPCGYSALDTRGLPSPVSFSSKSESAETALCQGLFALYSWSLLRPLCPSSLHLLQAAQQLSRILQYLSEDLRMLAEALLFATNWYELKNVNEQFGNGSPVPWCEKELG